jgi:hypothetical protein
MKKKIRNNLWTVAIAITSLAMSITACSNDDREAEKPFTTNPVESSKLYACGITQTETRGVTDAANVVFTEDDILWFDMNTREIRFRDTMEPLRETIPLLAGVNFYLSGEYLFSGGATHVGLICSQVFDDLVLCCGKIDGKVIDDGHYYLYDCYPLQFINDERVQANIKKNAAQWELFTKYLESKGKLRK